MFTDETVRTALLAFYKNRGVPAQNDASDMAAMREALTSALASADNAEVTQLLAAHSVVSAPSGGYCPVCGTAAPCLVRRVVDSLRATLVAAVPLEAPKETEPPEPVDSIRLCRGYEHIDGWNVPRDEYRLPVRYDPALPTRGEIEQEQGFAALNPTAIVLREWDERVLLHEVLHVLLDSHIQRTADDPHGHKVIAHIETALLLTGWRFLAAASLAPSGPQEGDKG